jgi:hypothetical protein
LSFTDDDVINLDEFIPDSAYNPHSVRPWLLHDHGFALAVVFADCLQDALDIAVDAGKLDRYFIEEKYNTPGTKGLPASDYPTLGTDNEEGITRLGNASEPFDIDALGYVELRNPQFSFCALWSAFCPTGRDGAGVVSSHFA